MAESALSLADKLRAALDRAEEIARAATAGPWAYDSGVIEAPEKAREVRLIGGYTSVDRWYVVCDSSTGQAVGDEDGRFIAANDPASVLRTVAAHRKILDRHTQILVQRAGRAGTWTHTCKACGERTPCPDVRDLAAAYFPEAPDASEAADG